MRTDFLIALDERGKSMTSSRLATKIGEWRDDGVGEICFAIGGADGHGDTVTSAARTTLSLGKLTLPHGLARIVLMEQLYRAATILAGIPIIAREVAFAWSRISVRAANQSSNTVGSKRRATATM